MGKFIVSYVLIYVWFFFPFLSSPNSLVILLLIFSLQTGLVLRLLLILDQVCVWSCAFSRITYSSPLGALFLYCIKSPVSTVIPHHLFTKNPLYFFKIILWPQIISHLYDICSHNNVLATVALATNSIHFTTTSAHFFRRCTLNFKWNQLCNWKWVQGSVKAENIFIVWYDTLKARASMYFSNHVKH
jgi:hypothetical protein